MADLADLADWKILGRRRILHLEDDELDALLVRHAIEHARLDADLIRVATPEAFQTALEHPGVAVIITDHRLPGFSSFDVLARARSQRPTVPVVVLSGASEDDQVARAREAGAAAFLTKDRLPQLVDVLRQWMDGTS